MKETLANVLTKLGCVFNGNMELLDRSSDFYLPNLADTREYRGHVTMLEVDVEQACKASKVLVLNCADKRDRQVRIAGVVPLRWGTPRILFLTPQQGRMLEETELFPTWRLWRYQWDGKHDLAVIGKPNRAYKVVAECLSE